MKGRWLALILLAAAGLAAYAGALGNPPLYDDSYLLAGNTQLTTSRLPSLLTTDYFAFFPGAATSWRPLSVLSYIVNRSLFGETWRSWRLVYLAVHIANGLLLMSLLGRFLPAGAAFAGAAIFLLHPIHAEAINQISYNEDLMASALLLAAVLLLLRWLGRPTPGGTAAVVGAYALALLAKETALLFPLVVAAWFLADRGGRDGDGERRGRPAMAALVGGTTVAYLWLQLAVMRNPFDRRPVEPLGGMLSSGVPAVLRLVADYLRRFVWPSGLAVTYAYPASSWSDPAVLAGLGALAALAALAAWGIVRRRPAVAAASVAVLGGLAPVYYNATHPGYQYGYDHYLYTPSLGLMALLAAGWASLGKSPRLRPFLSKGVPVAVVLALAASVTVIAARNRAWSSDESLWADAAAKQPRSALAQGSYGYALRRAGRLDQAESHLRRAIAINSGYPRTHYNLGLVLRERGRIDEAVVELSRAVDLDPGLAEAHADLGNLYLQQGKEKAAREALSTALALSPGLPGVHFALGVLHTRTGEYDLAQRDFAAVLEKDPANATVMVNLGNAYYFAGDRQRAAAEYTRALAVDPRSTMALGNMGAVRLDEGDLSAAEEWFRKALAVDPAFPAAVEGLKRIGAARNAPRRMGG